MSLGILLVCTRKTPNMRFFKLSVYVTNANILVHRVTEKFILTEFHCILKTSKVQRLAK